MEGVFSDGKTSQIHGRGPWQVTLPLNAVDLWPTGHFGRERGKRRKSKSGLALLHGRREIVGSYPREIHSGKSWQGGRGGALAVTQFWGEVFLLLR